MARASRAIAEGFRVSGRPLDPAVSAAVDAVANAIGAFLAIVLGGSHARGAGIRRTVGGESLALSDVDLHVVVADRAARNAAEARIAACRSTLVPALRQLGLVGPLEVGVHTAAEWASLPARPATLELATAGRVVRGDAAWLERLPRWTPRDVSAEEILLLLENRAYELIRAARDGDDDGVAGLAAAHAQYKTALDLAAVERLAAGALESEARALVAAARAGRAARAEIAPEPAWDHALAWREGATFDPATRRADLDAITECWWLRWSERAAPGVDAARFESTARRAASRARLRRRLRMALRPELAAAPPLARRLEFALAGTPQHRLNASAGAFLAAGVLARRAPAETAALEARLARLLASLGAVAPGDRAAVADRLLDAWNRQVLGATRGGAVA